MAGDNSPLSLMPSPVRYEQRFGPPLSLILPLFTLHSLIFYYFLSCAAAVGTIEYDYGISPKFVCTPIPPEADPSCYSPPSVPHGPSSSSHGNDHSGGSHRGAMSDEAKATILHLRESLVRQKETILDQRETIRELTAKLTLCEGFGSHHSIGQHQNHKKHHDTHHDTQHSSHLDNHNSHHDEHHGHHGSHHGPSSLHHGPTGHHGSDHHSSHDSHRSDLHHRTGLSYSKQSSFSPEQTGKTLQTLKERLENLQARNSSSSYSSSLRELLQRKINALEEQLHNYRDHHDHHADHHDDSHDDDHSSSSHYDNHHSNHHGGHSDDLPGNHHGTAHHEDHHSSHHGSHRYNHHSNHHNRHYDPHYNWHHGLHSGHHEDHHNSHHNDHHNDHHDDHHGTRYYDNHHNNFHEPGHHDDHHDDHHGNHHGTENHELHHPGENPPRRLPYTSSKETSLQGSGHSKLETVLSQLHHSNDHGNHKKLKSPSAFLLEFPMRTNYMYARMKRSVVNEIFALTICLWLKPGEGPGLGTPISYAVPGQANELVLMEWGSNPMELLINDKAVTLPITLTDGKWHHVCVTWSTRDGVWEAYQDGVKKGSGQNLSAWHPITPGGIFILGQEQDTMGGRYDITQSFLGELSDLQFWSRVLTANEIHTQATCGGHLVGDIMSWSEEQVELHGGLTELPFEPCH
ncbi:neuronal pentraxin-1-like [Girardinichthys multiradiatus]|uniref:neuronal pentraxin-1-like n=1 Tax=Girardinichthys multiradiatus TaxID=208333 RepID=UPI001FADCF0E|nr:neuronal pentraxin-1-like [Girardinichthys multiradiatus]XP_047239235.1 neuronal pentraxin-1-like [Girardinichthys multiradiatus]